MVMWGLNKHKNNPHRFHAASVPITTLLLHLVIPLLRNSSVWKKQPYMSSSLMGRVSTWQQINENVTWLLPLSLRFRNAPVSILTWQPACSNSAATIHTSCSDLCPFITLFLLVSACLPLFEPRMLVWLKEEYGLCKVFEWYLTFYWHNRSTALWN